LVTSPASKRSLVAHHRHVGLDRLEQHLLLDVEQLGAPRAHPVLGGLGAGDGAKAVEQWLSHRDAVSARKELTIFVDNKSVGAGLRTVMAPFHAGADLADGGRPPAAQSLRHTLISRPQLSADGVECRIGEISLAQG
jgi:hypothetical protein